jgi:hypothetical protein
MAISGQRPYQALVKHPGSTAMAGQWAILSALGADPARWKTMSPAERANLMDTLTLVHASNPAALGGMTPDQVRDEMNRDSKRGVSGPQAERALEDLHSAFNRPGGNPRQQAMARALREGGVNPRTVGGFIEAARTGHTQNLRVKAAMKAAGLGKTIDSPAEVMSLSQQILTGRNQAAGTQAAKKTQVEIQVQKPYDQIFDAMIKGGGGKSGTTNSKRSFGRKATSFAEHVGEDIAKSLLPGW